MKLIIETKYYLIDNEGVMFSSTGTETKGEVKSKAEVDSLIEVHEEKLGQRERMVRTHVDDYVNFIPDKENF